MKEIDVKPILSFFPSVSEDAAVEEGVVAGLQSLETVFLLIGSRRWPSVIVMSWMACEMLLQEKYPGSEEKVYVLQDWFKEDCSSLSAELHGDAHNLRKFRNDIAHQGYSPKFDEKSVRFFFSVFLPYFDILLQDRYGQTVSSLLNARPDHRWFWLILEQTREVVVRKLEQPKVQDLIAACDMLVIAVRKIIATNGIVSEFYAPYNHYEALTAHTEDGYEARLQAIRDALETTKAIEEGSETMWLDDMHCLICNEDSLLVVPEVAGEDEIDGIKAFACWECYYLITDRDITDVFMFSKLSSEQRDKLASWSTPPAANELLPHGY